MKRWLLAAACGAVLAPFGAGCSSSSNPDSPPQLSEEEQKQKIKDYEQQRAEEWGPRKKK